VQELSGGGAILANLLTGLGIDEYFTRTDGSGRRSLLGDALGSILALTDDAGVVQTTYTYEPFGQTTVTGQANGNPFQYTGRENDGTGLYYYRARYYSATRGRFLIEDPARQHGDNWYAYVANSPLNFVDPWGLQIPFPPQPLPLPPPPPPPPYRPSPPSSPPAPSSPSPMPNEKMPDPKNPPPNWQPHPSGKPGTWTDPHDDTWHWHDDPKHGPRHWDIGGPSKGGEKGKQEWWPEGGKRGPKPPGKDRKVSLGGGGAGGFGGWGAGGRGFGGRKDF